MQGDMTDTRMKNMMTVDLEDWYHSNDTDAMDDVSFSFPQIERNTDLILDMFDKYRIMATFFVLGCIAEQYPELIRRIDQKGHEIGSHGYRHKMVNRMTPEEFRTDIRESCNAIERVTGKKVRSYRAPSWSIDTKNLWALEILEEEGIWFDCSLQPFKTYLSGDLKIPCEIFHPIVNGRRISLLEIPSSVFRFLGLRIPFAGGFYLRLWPKCLVHMMMELLNRKQPAVVYLHPWEIETKKTRVKGGLLANFIRYANLKTTLNKLESLLKKFRFIPVRDLCTDNDYPNIELNETKEKFAPMNNSGKEMSEKAISGMMILNILLAGVALIRDIAFASVLGTSSRSDALLLAFFIPDIMGNNLIAMALGIALIPVLTNIVVNRGFGHLRGFIWKIMAGVAVYGVVFVSIAFFSRTHIVGWLGQGMEQSVRLLSTGLFTVLLPSVIFFPLYTIGASISNVHSSFKIPCIGPILFNLFFLAGILAAYAFHPVTNTGVYIIAIAMLFGVIAMAASVWMNVLFRGWLRSSPIDGQQNYKEETSRLIRILIPYILVLFSYQSVLYSERYLASFFEAGTISGLNYAYRISQLPLWVFIAAVGTFSLPRLSVRKSSNKIVEFKDDIVKYLRLTLLIILPFCSIFFFLREPIISLFFQWGAFDTRSISVTSGILGGFAVAILGQGIFAICIRVFLSMRYITIPALAVVFSSVLNIVSNIVLTSVYGSAGLGMGAAIGGVSNGILLIFILNRKTDGLLVEHWKTFGKVIAANIPVMCVAYLLSLIWGTGIAGSNVPLRFITGGTMIITPVVVYFIVLVFFRIIRRGRATGSPVSGPCN